MRKTKNVCADSIDGIKENIPDHFKGIYENLYNCVEDAEDVVKISEEIETNINETSLSDVDKVTSEEVKKAAMLLKPGKGDPSFSSEAQIGHSL